MALSKHQEVSLHGCYVLVFRTIRYLWNDHEWVIYIIHAEKSVVKNNNCNLPHRDYCKLSITSPISPLDYSVLGSGETGSVPIAHCAKGGIKQVAKSITGITHKGIHKHTFKRNSKSHAHILTVCTLSQRIYQLNLKKNWSKPVIPPLVKIWHFLLPCRSNVILLKSLLSGE